MEEFKSFSLFVIDLELLPQLDFVILILLAHEQHGEGWSHLKPRLK